MAAKRRWMRMIHWKGGNGNLCFDTEDSMHSFQFTTPQRVPRGVVWRSVEENSFCEEIDKVAFVLSAIKMPSMWLTQSRKDQIGNKEKWHTLPRQASNPQIGHFDGEGSCATHHPTRQRNVRRCIRCSCAERYYWTKIDMLDETVMVVTTTTIRMYQVDVVVEEEQGRELSGVTKRRWW